MIESLSFIRDLLLPGVAKHIAIAFPDHGEPAPNDPGRLSKVEWDIVVDFARDELVLIILHCGLTTPGDLLTYQVRKFPLVSRAEIKSGSYKDLFNTRCVAAAAQIKKEIDGGDGEV